MPVTSREVGIPAIPPWAARFASNDIDEVRAVVGRMDGEHSRVADGNGPLGFRLAWLNGAACKVIGWGRMRVGQTIRGAVPEPALHVVVPPKGIYRLGRKVFTPSPGVAMFLAPGWEFTRISPPGDSFGLNFDGSRLAAEFDHRLALRRDKPVFRMQALDLSPAERGALLAIADELVLASQPAAGPAARPHAEAAVVACVAGLMLKHRAVARGQEVSAARIAGLEHWIDGHLTEPLTIGRLCEVSGVGERALQKAFFLRRGMSPMRFVTERRLALGRKRLTQPGTHEDVTSVAVDLGFGHVGRFAQLYRQAFGESPSASLRHAAATPRRRAQRPR